MQSESAGISWLLADSDDHAPALPPGVGRRLEIQFRQGGQIAERRREVSGPLGLVFFDIFLDDSWLANVDPFECHFQTHPDLEQPQTLLGDRSIRRR